MSTDIIFSANPTRQLEVEGLAVDIRKQEGSITGADVNTPGLFDVTLRGPTTPQVVASLAEFLDLYGGRDAGGGGAIVNNIWKGMLNRKFAWPMVIQRVYAADAAKATANASDANSTSIIKIEATSSGTWANGATGHGITYAITDASDGTGTHYNLVIKYGGQVITYRNLNTNTGTDDNTTSVIGAALTNLVTVTKLADGRPINTVSDVSLANGTDGTVAASDYTDAFDKLAAHPRVRIMPIGCSLMVDASGHEAVNNHVTTNASEYPLTTFLTWSGANNSYSAEITAKAAHIPTGQDNVWHCYNASSTQDSTGTLIETGPHLDMALILSNTDVAIHPGAEQNIKILSHIKSVANDTLKRTELALLRAAGICTLEHVSNGFQFKSVVASSSVGPVGAETAVEGVDVRRRAWLVESAASSIRHDIKRAATGTNRATIINKLTAFASDDQEAEHVVDKDSEDLGKAWLFQWVETATERARNIGKLLFRIRMLAYMLVIIMQVDVGTGVITFKVEKL